MLAKAIRATNYKDYVPLVHEMEGRKQIKQGQGMQTKGSGIKRALGRDSAPDNVLLNSIAKAEQSVVLAEKSRVAQALYRLVKANPDPSFWEIAENSTYIAKGSDGIAKELWDQRVDIQDRKVDVMVDGKQKTIVFANKAKDIVRAMDRSSIEQLNAILRGSSYLLRKLSMVNTSLNPVFVFTNFVRDVQTVGIGVGVAHGTKAAKIVTKRALSAVRGIHATEAGKVNEWSPLWERLNAAGGRTGFYHAKSIEEMQKDLTKRLRKLDEAKTSVDKARKLANATGQFVEDWNMSVENGVRLSVFKYAVEELGLSDADGAVMAKNASTDFNVKGEASWLSSLYMFANAGIQGSTMVARTLLTTKRGRKTMYGLMAFGVTLDLVASALSGVNDDGEDEWDSVPEYKKDRNIMIPTGDGEYFAIPMPYGFSFFVSAGRQISELGRGASSATETFGKVVSSAMGSFSPIGEATDMSWAGIARTLSPTITDLPLGLAANEDWKGAPIRPKDFSTGHTDTPQSQLYWRSTPSMYVASAGALNRMSGGDQFERGGMDYSPEDLQHIVRWVGGGMLRFAEDTVGVIAGIGDDAKGSILQGPFVRQFYYSESERKGYFSFRENAAEIQLLGDRVEGYRSTGDHERSSELRRENEAVFKMVADLKALDRRRRSVARTLKASTDEEANEKLSADLYEEVRAFNVQFQKAKAKGPQ